MFLFPMFLPFALAVLYRSGREFQDLKPVLRANIRILCDWSHFYHNHLLTELSTNGYDSHILNLYQTINEIEIKPSLVH
jgi:hypothetical protein